MEPSQTEVVAPSSPLAKAIAGPYQGCAGRGLLRYDGDLLGDVRVEEAYLYPSSPAPVQ
jgi:hypothetical protein